MPPPNHHSKINFNLLFLMGRLNWFAWWRAWRPQAYAEQRKNEIKFEEFNWVFLLAKHEARRTASSTNTQTLNSLPHLLPADKEWSLNVLGWNGIVWFVVLAALSLGGLRAASSPHCSAQRETSSSKQHNKENNGMKASAAPNQPQTTKEKQFHQSLIGGVGWVCFCGGYGAEPICATPLRYKPINDCFSTSAVLLPLSLCCNARKKTSNPINSTL